MKRLQEGRCQMGGRALLAAAACAMIPAVSAFSVCPGIGMPPQSLREHAVCGGGRDRRAGLLKLKAASELPDVAAGLEKWGAPALSYIEPVFRPPAEAYSLILQVTNGCSWNKCTFCEMYTADSKEFRLKPIEVVEHEIKALARMGGDIKTLNRIFLGDGDAMMLPFKHLQSILGLINLHMPWVKRISSYCLPRNIRTKTVEQLAELKNMGLTTLYVGCESGDDEVLRLVNKGETYQSSLDALNKIHAAGLKSSVMILTGLGGTELSHQHAVNSARLVSQANPTYVSTLILTFPLGKERFVGNFPSFHELSTTKLLAETRTFIEASDMKKSIFRSDHASNYLSLKGVLGKDKERLLQEIDAALAGQTRLRPEWMRGL